MSNHESNTNWIALFVMFGNLIFCVQFAPAQLRDSAGYSLIPFDTSKQQLSPKYLGHNARALYLAMEQKNQKLFKDEFETTEENRQRILVELSKPILGWLDIISMYAFKVNKLETSYDADNQILTVKCPLSNTSSNQTPDIKSVSWSFENNDEGSYLGTNAFGATVNIHRTTCVSYDIAISNYDVIPAEGNNESIHNNMSYAIKISISPSEARTLKESISALAVGEIYHPIISNHAFYSGPTFKSPSSHTFLTYNFHIELFQLWFFDSNSGTVIAKLKRNDKK